MRRRIVVAGLIVLIAAGVLFYSYGRSIWMPMYVRMFGARSVADVLGAYGAKARERMAPHFEKAGVQYPPQRIALLVFKKERRLAVWAAGADGRWRYVRSYPVLAASGEAGPKLREGDRQVPEGLYRISWLNPNSSYHLSMKVDYPNDFDRRMAARERRTRLGGDIFIHGNAVSIGCVAIGDRAIEELFTLVADTGHARVKVIIAPNDLRIGRPVTRANAPAWLAGLYRSIAAALAQFPAWMEADARMDVRGMPKSRVSF